MRKILLLPVVLIFALCNLTAYGQDYSNKGKDFWIVYTGHIDGTTSRMALYITSDQNASGTMSVNGSTVSFTVTANQVTTLRLTNATVPSNSLAYNSQTTGVGTNRGIHIVTDNAVVVYSHILNSARSGSTLVLPTNVLGREYYVSGYASVGGNNSRSEFAVVATEDNTLVEINPKLTDAANTYPANTPFQVTLNKGDVFQYQSANSTDLSGTSVKSIASANAPCKPIAVFAGSTWTAMGCPSAGSGDNLYQELFPLGSWGQTYITAPFILRSFDIFRIMVKDPATVVQVNGVTLNPATLVNNSFYEFNTSGNNTSRIITADKPVCVVQYMITQNCDNVNSDPEMIILNPIEQTLNDITVLSARNDLTPPNTNITRHFINIIIKTAGLSSLRIDGALPIATPVTIGTTGYSYLQEELTASTLVNPAHRIYADSGFVAIAYGYGNVESYGYNAGTNVRDLYQFITVQNPYATVPFPAACKSTPFYFSIVFPYQPTQITWDFNGLFPNVILSNPVYDSTWIVNGKQLYRYKIFTPYTINTVGTYPIKVLAVNPTPDGCGTQQEINYNLQVFDQPVADFTFNNICFPDPVQFTDNSNTGGRPVISRYWDFGDLTSSGANNPSHAFTSTGNYNVSYSLITDVGCLSDTTTHIVTVSPLPTAGISGSTSACLNGPSPSLWFNGVIGTAPFTFTYSLNGGPPQTIVSTSGNLATLSVPTNVATTLNYTLLQVQDNSPTHCSQAQSGTATFIIKPLPTATVTGSVAVCTGAPSPMVTFTGSGGSAPYTFVYNINGGTSQTITTVSGNSISIPASTATTGIFSYNLESVTEGSPQACSASFLGNVIITVNPLPTATISGNSTVCQNTTPPQIIFTSASGTPPFIFSYQVNGGPVQTVTSTGFQATVNAPTNNIGVFQYDLVSVVDASTTLCSQLQAGSVTVIIKPLPVSAYSFSTPSCDSNVVNFTDLSIPNAGSIASWVWIFGDPLSGLNNSSALQNPTHLFSGPGTYTVTLTTSNNNGCSSVAFTRQVIIHPKPLAGYILPDVCLSDTYAQFSDTSKVALPDNISNWHWDFGDPVSGVNNTSVLQNPQHSYTATGVYPVELIVTSSNGCKDTVNQLLSVNGSFPQADFNILSPATLCANDSVAISEASSVFPGIITKVEIYWDNTGAPAVFDRDDVPYTGKIYKHLYPDFQSPLTKTFNIRYRAYSGGVCVNDKIKAITVNAAPKVQFAAIPDICLDAIPFALTQGSEIGGVPGSGIYTGPGITGVNTFNPLLAGAGTHTILYTYTSSAAGCVDTISQTIKVRAAAVPDFTVSTPACETKLITFTQSSTTPEGTLTGWVWDFGDGSPVLNSVNGNPVTHTYANWGNYNVKLKVITSFGCVSADKIIPVSVHPQPKPDFSLPASLCLPSANATFNDLSSIADGTQSSFTYYWDFGDPGSGPVNNSTAMNPSHVYINATVYPVNLQVTSVDGCKHDTTILLNTIHAQPVAAFSTDKAGVCVGESFHFTDNTVQAGGNATQWNWLMGDGNGQSVPAFNYTYAAAGTYNVSLFTFNNFGCRSTTFTSPVVVYPYPVVDAGPDRLVLEGGQAVLLATATGNNLTYVWTPNRYFAGPNTILNPTINGVDDITYLLTVTAEGGCKDTSSVFIKVLKYPAVPNIFSPNGDGVHDQWVIQYLETYPGCTVDIFNRYGQKVFHSEGYSHPWDGKINGRDAPVGTYYYIIDPKHGRKIMSGHVDLIR